MFRFLESYIHRYMISAGVFICFWGFVFVCISKLSNRLIVSNSLKHELLFCGISDTDAVSCPVDLIIGDLFATVH